MFVCTAAATKPTATRITENWSLQPVIRTRYEQKGQGRSTARLTIIGLTILGRLTSWRMVFSSSGLTSGNSFDSPSLTCSHFLLTEASFRRALVRLRYREFRGRELGRKNRDGRSPRRDIDVPVVSRTDRQDRRRGWRCTRMGFIFRKKQTKRMCGVIQC